MPKILVVEDDQALSSSLVLILGAVYELEIAGSIKEARKSFSSTNFDVVLLDKTLPDGDALTLIEEFREKRPRSAIVMMTGDKNFSLVTQAMNHGVDDYVFKDEGLVSNLLVRIPVAIKNRALKNQISALEKRPESTLPQAEKDLTKEKYESYFKQVERAYFVEACRICDFDVNSLSNKLKISRSTVFKKINDLSLRENRYKGGRPHEA